MNYDPNLLYAFIDESLSRQTLDITLVDRDKEILVQFWEGFFTTSAVVVDGADAAAFDSSVLDWKRGHNVEHVPLHGHEIASRTGNFEFLNDLTSEDRNEWYASLARLLEGLPYHLICGVICDIPMQGINFDKRECEWAVEFLIERLRHIGWTSKKKVHLIVEDGHHETFLALLRRIMASGTSQMEPSLLHPHFTGKAQFVPKASALAGLEIADLSAYPAGATANTPDSPHRSFAAIQDHLYTGGWGKPSSYGLKAWPPRDRAEKLKSLLGE